MSRLMLLFAALAALGAALLVIGGPATETTQARDRDGDGIPDRWERRHGLSTTKKSGRRDLDGDRLRNRREFRLHLNPRRLDSDGDHLGDRAELTRWNTNPRKRDTDGDGLRDRREVKKLKTKPRRRDTDRDGLGDGREVKRLRTNPRKRDTDGDGFSDRREIRAGTNPRDKRSHPRRRRRAAPPASPAPAPGGFPTPSNTGVPAGWTPAQTRSTSLRVTTPGAVVEDILFTNGAGIEVEAPNVTIRRVKLEGGIIENDVDGDCDDALGMLVEDVTITPVAGQDHDNVDHYALGSCGYTARRLEMHDRSDGLRVGAKPGPVVVENSYINVKCFAEEFHTDGIQGYGGDRLTVRNATIDYEGGCGTAPFFYPHSQGNTRADVDRLLVMGGGYSFRMGTPGTVRNLKIVDQSWGYGPIDVKCSALSAWDASLVTITSNYQIARTVRSQPCNTEAGG
jgi:Bacterial TSP3 repeat